MPDLNDTLRPRHVITFAYNGNAANGPSLCVFKLEPIHDSITEDPPEIYLITSVDGLTNIMAYSLVEAINACLNVHSWALRVRPAPALKD